MHLHGFQNSRTELQQAELKKDVRFYKKGQRFYHPEIFSASVERKDKKQLQKKQTSLSCHAAEFSGTGFLSDKYTKRQSKQDKAKIKLSLLLP